MYAAYRYTLHRMLEARLDAIRKQGYPVTSAELDKWYAQPPPAENGADLYIQANERCNRWTNALPQPLVITNTTATRTTSFRAENKVDLLPIVGLAKLP